MMYHRAALLCGRTLRCVGSARVSRGTACALPQHRAYSQYTGSSEGHDSHRSSGSSAGSRAMFAAGALTGACVLASLYARNSEAKEGPAHLQTYGVEDAAEAVRAATAQSHAAAKNEAAAHSSVDDVHEAMKKTRPMEECISHGHEVLNWSGTHRVKPLRFYEPQTVEELQCIMRECDKRAETLRVVGNAISPNGIGFSDVGMVSLRALDRVLSVDVDKLQVTVQPGITVRELVDALEPYGMTLENFASIDEQQIGGFYQVGAHGSGGAIPPVEEQLVSMKLLTPANGIMHLSKQHSPNLFRMAKVGLGALGVMVEATIQCVPRHRLIERTFVMTRQEVMENHSDLLKRNKHLRYLWIPYTDNVVVVTCNPVADNYSLPKEQERIVALNLDDSETEDDPALAAREMLRRADKQLSAEEIDALTFTQLRDRLLAVLPHGMASVRRVNIAESEYWRHSQGFRVDWSDRILGFDCGGSQWVSEVCIPCGKEGTSDGDDLAFVLDVLDMIEKHGIAAPSPIEQRWTARSTSYMSPAFSNEKHALFSWVGIIMYVPTEDEPTKEQIASEFEQYKDLCRPLWQKYDAKQHWAKIERPRTSVELMDMRSRIAAAYPVNAFNEVRTLLDPHSILSNCFIKNCFDPKIRGTW